MKHLTITLLTLLVSMGVNPTSIGFIYVPGSDDGGWIILLLFLGYWVFIAISAFVSSFFSKDEVEEDMKREKNKK